MDKGPDGKFAEGNKLGRRFRPGQSGNPKGRPKSVTLSEAYRRKLAEVDETDPHGRTHAEIIAEQMMAKAKGATWRPCARSPTAWRGRPSRPSRSRPSGASRA